MTDPGPAVKTIVVAGDVVMDHHHYEPDQPPSSRGTAKQVGIMVQPGGAALLRDLIATLLPNGKAGTLVLPPKPSSGQSEFAYEMRERGRQAFAVWSPFRAAAKDDENAGKTKVWRLRDKLGYGEPVEHETPLLLRAGAQTPKSDVLVLDDADLGFRAARKKDFWQLPANPAEQWPRWILLKMSGVLAKGDLWRHLASHFADRLVGLVSMDDLRRETVRLGPGVSWERTLEDVSRALHRSADLRPLMECRHLIVTFSADGALWIEKETENKTWKARIFFDARGAEGDYLTKFDGGMIGFETAMAASLARGLALADPLDPDLSAAIWGGLYAKRTLMRIGHGNPDDKTASPRRGYPIDRIAAAIDTATDAYAKREDETETALAERKIYFATCRLVWPLFARTADDRPYPSGKSSDWMMLERAANAPAVTIQPAMFNVACDLLLRGQEKAFRNFPHARFGKLTTADRSEIETLRNIRRLMAEYRDAPRGSDLRKRPLSIGVFGPPGAGKSFGVKQIANEVFDESCWREFNLSQFTPPGDLIGALHQVRDMALEGKIPVVFWDEFDSREYDWLQYLLAPMQDGTFQEGQTNHPVGRCVFIFAGGTCPSFERFRELGEPTDNKAAEFKSKKGPDFRSRIDAYYDVLGPNPRLTYGRRGVERVDPSDRSFVVRRALLIQSMLKSNGAPLKDMDLGLLNALLRTGAYVNGARSLEKILQAVGQDGFNAIRRSTLPSPAQIGMHVRDPDAFYQLLEDYLTIELFIGSPGEKPLDMKRPINRLAAAIHEEWRKLARAQGNITKEFDRNFEDLDDEGQADNWAAARRIPWILLIAGLAVEPDDRTNSPLIPEAVAKLLDHNMERLAEFEHDGWMKHRIENGWTLGEKDNALKRHNLLVEYAKLPDKEKEKDRTTIRKISDFLGNAGYRIVEFAARHG